MPRLNTSGWGSSRHEAAEHEKILLIARIKITKIGQTEDMPRSLETALGLLASCLGNEEHEAAESLTRRLSVVRPRSEAECGATRWVLCEWVELAAMAPKGWR
jgi:hypothetical protein